MLEKVICASCEVWAVRRRLIKLFATEGCEEMLLYSDSVWAGMNLSLIHILTLYLWVVSRTEIMYSSITADYNKLENSQEWKKKYVKKQHTSKANQAAGAAGAAAAAVTFSSWCRSRICVWEDALDNGTRTCSTQNGRCLKGRLWRRQRIQLKTLCNTIFSRK